MRARRRPRRAAGVHLHVPLKQTLWYEQSLGHARYEQSAPLYLRTARMAEDHTWVAGAGRRARELSWFGERAKLVAEGGVRKCINPLQNLKTGWRPALGGAPSYRNPALA